MAIVQISRITNRKGLRENLPQLAGAEFGWCIDTRQLFIGNGTLQEGAPIIGNTEILTEFSDIADIATYIYKDAIVGYEPDTGPTIRTVQEKLDDFCSIRDFGAVGDGSTDDTEAIKRAIYEIYCIPAQQGNEAIRRTIYFPAGTYIITESLVIPPYAKFVGEGANCTTIFLDITATDPCVARFGNNALQTGSEIFTTGTVAPRNIEISFMTFQAAAAVDVFLIEAGNDCYFESVNFTGPLSISGITTATPDLTALKFQSVNPDDSSLYESIKQITIDKCRFSNATYGVKSDAWMQSVTISDGNFSILYQGVVLGTGPVTEGGPSGVRVAQNRFDTIYAQGVIFDDVIRNVSSYNTFYDVANGLSVTPIAPVIEFGNEDNASVADQFSRTELQNNIYPRVYVQGTSTGSGSHQIALGRYSRTSGQTRVLAVTASPSTIFSVGFDIARAFRVDYTVYTGDAVRYGQFVVVCQDFGDSTITLSYEDSYTENSNLGFTLSAVQNGDLVDIQYTTTLSGTDRNFVWSISHLA